jgi:hypothetical protein
VKKTFNFSTCQKKSKQESLNLKIYFTLRFLLIATFNSFSQTLIASRFLRNIGFSANVTKAYDFSAREQMLPIGILMQ